MAPIFKAGYYPGDKPIRKNPIQPVENLDPFMEAAINAISFDRDALGLPNRMATLLEKDYRNGFAIRYGIRDQNYVDDNINRSINAGLAGSDLSIEEEYNELPGVRGAKINLDPETIAKVGAGGVVSNTFKSMLDAGFAFKDFSLKAELYGLWDPLLNPGVSSDSVRAGMSLSSSDYIKRYQPGVTGKILTQRDFSNVDSLNSSIRAYVLSSGSAVEEQASFTQVKYFYFQSFRQAFENSPEIANIDADILTSDAKSRQYVTDISTLTSTLATTSDPATRAVLSQQLVQAQANLAGEQSKAANLQSLKAEADDLKQLFSGVRTPEDLVKDARKQNPKAGFNIKKLRANERRLMDNFWKASVHGKNTSITRMAGIMGDRRLIAWSRLIDYRERVSETSEVIDAIAKGEFFQQFIWKKYVLKRLPWITPTYAFSKFFTNPGDFFWRAFVNGKIPLPFTEATLPFFKIPFVTGLFNRFGALADRLVGWVSDLIVKRFAKVINLFGGNVIKSAFSKISGWLYGVGAGSGVGLPAVVVAAITQYLGEKIFGLFKSIFDGDFFEYLEKLQAEAARLVRFLFGVVLLLISSCLVFVTIATSILFLPFSGMMVQDYGSGGGVEETDVDCPFVDESELPRDANGVRLDNVKPLEDMINALTNTYANPKRSPMGVGTANEDNIRKCYGYIIARALQTANDPAIALAIWIEETGASNYEVYNFPIDDFGCGRPIESNNFMDQLECFLRLQTAYATKPSHAECRATEPSNTELIVHEWGQIFACGDLACREGRAYDFSCLAVCGTNKTAPECIDGTLWFDNVNTIYSAVSIGDKTLDLDCILTGSTIRWDDTCKQGSRINVDIRGVTGLLGQNLPNFFRRIGYKEVISDYDDYIIQCYETRVTYNTGCPLASGNYLHCGLDLVGDTVDGIYSVEGKDVRSPYRGTAVVDTVGYDAAGYGNYVVLEISGDGGDDDSNEDFLYILVGHLIDGSIGVSVGEQVAYNDFIGRVGSTGHSTGPHVHYEIRSGGRSAAYQVNPCYVVAFSGESCPGTTFGSSCSTAMLE